MIHSMHLNIEPFEKIKKGEKDIEIRINDKKRQKVNIDDEIVFILRDDEDQRIKVKITDLIKKDSFEELFKHINLEDPEEMSKYYPKEEEKEFGVVGIKFEKIDE